MKVKKFFYSTTRKQPIGSILLEAIVSILLLSLIILGSIYSYSFVHQRIKRQNQHRILLGFLQGWMEKTRAYLMIEIFSINDEALLGDSNHIAFLTIKVNNIMRQEIEKDISESAEIGVFHNNPDVLDYAINMTPDENNRFIHIDLSVNLNKMPIRAYTQISTYGNWKTYK